MENGASVSPDSGQKQFAQASLHDRVGAWYITVKANEDVITKAVGLVGYKCLAGVGYLAFSTEYGFDDEVLHLSHQHWHGADKGLQKKKGKRRG